MLFNTVGTLASVSAFFFYTTPNHGVPASKNIRKTKTNRLHNFKKTIQQEGLATETFLNMADSAGEYLMQSWLLGARLATEIQQRVYLFGFRFGSLDCKC